MPSGLPVLDTVGSVVIGCMMLVVSTFLCKSNMDALLGK